MKRENIYIAIVAGLFVLLVVGLVIQPDKVSWEKTYVNTDKNPFGTSALYELMGDIFPGESIEEINSPANELAYDRQKDSLSGKHANYILIKDNSQFDVYETRAMLEMAKNGDHIFIASENIGGPFLDSLGVVSLDQVNENGVYNGTDSMRLNFKQPELYASKGFTMRPGEQGSFIHIPDSVKDIAILSVNSYGNAVFIKKNYGKGAVYYHSVPLAFTNYYMIYTGNHGYISRCLSFLPVTHVYWDEFYKTGRTESNSPIRVILNNPALRTAYILVLFLIAIYMLFQSKRRQRIIPVIKPFENSTLQFVATVSRLYYNKGDHTSLAKKKLVYLKERMRLKFQIPIEFNDEETVLAVSARSGVNVEATRTLLKQMDYINKAIHINESELFRFNKLIEDFWKQSVK